MTYESQVVAGPLAIYFKAFVVGSATPAMPAIDRSSANLIGVDGWSLLGRRGADSLKRDGVTVESSQEFAEFMGANSIKVSDRWRTKDELMVKCSLIDLRMESVALALDQTVTSNLIAVPKYKEVGLGHAKVPMTWSILARGRSPYANDEGKFRQYFLYACNVTSSYSEANALDNPTEIPFEFKPVALFDAALAEHERFGKLRSWSAP